MSWGSSRLDTSSSGGVIVSYGEDGDPVSVAFLNACERGLVEPGEISVRLRHDEASV